METIGEAALRLLQGMEARCGRESPRRPNVETLKAFGVVIRLNLGGVQRRNWEANAGYVRLCVQANDVYPLWAFEDEVITLDDYDW